MSLTGSVIKFLSSLLAHLPNSKLTLLLYYLLVALSAVEWEAEESQTTIFNGKYSIII